MVRSRVAIPPSRSRSRDPRRRAAANIFLPARSRRVASSSRRDPSSPFAHRSREEPWDLRLSYPSRSERGESANDYSGLRNFVTRGISPWIPGFRARRVAPRGSQTSRAPVVVSEKNSTASGVTSATCSERKYVSLATCHGVWSSNVLSRAPQRDASLSRFSATRWLSRGLINREYRLRGRKNVVERRERKFPITRESVEVAR